MNKEKLENWQIEINRLNKIRLDLGITLYKFEQITGIKRGNLQGVFELKNIPSLKRYLEIKEALENQIEVKDSKIEIKLIKEQKPKVKVNSCDCKLDTNGLLRRGKIKCSKPKEEHNF